MIRPAKVPLNDAQSAATSQDARIVVVDCLRGAALFGMILYHLAWDLHAFGLSPMDPGTSWAPRLFGHAVATTFLGLSGFGIALAGRHGLNFSRAARRLGGIAAAAAAVTVATRIVAPDATVWFGILHCILVTNIVALSLQRTSNAVLVTLGLIAAAIPWVLPPPFASVGLEWTGLSDAQPATLDFRPVLPWLSPVLLGMAVGRARFVDGLPRISPRSAIYRSFATAGRHSLLVYLLHQPLLIGSLVALYGLPETHLTPALILSEPKQAANFLHSCRNECVALGRDGELCNATCHCVLTATLAHLNPKYSLATSATDAMRAYLAACQPNP